MCSEGESKLIKNEILSKAVHWFDDVFCIHSAWLCAFQWMTIDLNEIKWEIDVGSSCGEFFIEDVVAVFTMAFWY